MMANLRGKYAIDFVNASNQGDAHVLTKLTFPLLRMSQTHIDSYLKHQADKAKQEAEDASRAADLPHGLTFIIADDDKQVRQISGMQLKSLKANLEESQVLGETSGEIADLHNTVINLCSQQPASSFPVVLLIDQNMDQYPNGEKFFGTDVIRRIRTLEVEKGLADDRRPIIVVRSANAEGHIKIFSLHNK